MATYKYTAVNRKGETLTGVMDGRSPEDVASILLESSLSPIKISEKFDFLDNFTQVPIAKQKIPLKEKVNFFREFSTMIEAGLPLDQALDISHSQTSNKGFQNVLNQIKVDVRGGSSLGDAFSKYPKIFQLIEVNLIKAGEASGKLDEVLNRLADDVQNSQSLQSKIRGAFVYPAFVLVVAAVVVIVIVTKLVPSMQSLYEGFGIKSLPGPTEFLVVVSNILTNYYIVIAIVLIILVATFTYYVKTPDGKAVWDTLILKLPIFGDLLSKYQLVKFIKTYILLISAGIPVINALNLVANSMSNALFVKAIKDSAEKVEKGISLAVALSAYDVVPSILWKTLQIGEETGKTEQILTKIGKYYEDEVNDKVNNLTRLIEPVLLVVLGGIVGFIAIAIYLPIYNFATFIG